MLLYVITEMTHNYSSMSLIVQLVNNPPAMQETPVQFLGWEDALEKGLMLVNCGVGEDS